MKRIRPLAVGTAVLLLGGLLGWHVYLDRTEYRPPAVNLSNGECLGTLNDPGFFALLGHTPRVFVNSRFLPPTPDAKPGMDCGVEGQRGRTLQVMATSAEYPANGIEGEAAFNCVLNGKTESYRAAVRFGRDFPRDNIPDREHLTELVTGFAKRAAEKLGCANGAGALTVR